MGDYPHVKRMEYWSQDLTRHGARERGILPQIHKISGSLSTLRIGNDSCLTATHKHSTHGSTLRVKNNIAAPTGKLHGEVRHKELEFGPLPRQMHHGLTHSIFNNVYKLSWNKNQLNCEATAK